MLGKIDTWFKSRPSVDDVSNAISEATILIEFCNLHGQKPDVENLKKILMWMVTAEHLPLEWVEQKIQSEIYGKR